MTVKSGAVWSGLVVTRDATGALSAASVGPAGTLYVDGVANAAVVTVAGANPYSWTVTLPALTAGQCVSMYLTATVDTIATAAVVAEDVADTSLNSDLATTIGAAGAGLTAVPWNAAWDAEVQSEATDALNAYDPPTDTEMDAALLALIGADGDTLETLSDEIAAIDCTIAVSAATASTVATGTASITRFYTWSQSFTSTATANLSAATKLWAVGKLKLSTADDDAEFFIEETGGLTRLAGAAYATTTNGSITVSGSSGAWSVTCKLEEAVTGSLRELTAAKFAIKALVAGDTVDVWSGNMNIATGPIVAIS